MGLVGVFDFIVVECADVVRLTVKVCLCDGGSLGFSSHRAVVSEKDQAGAELGDDGVALELKKNDSMRVLDSVLENHDVNRNSCNAQDDDCQEEHVEPLHRLHERNLLELVDLEHLVS